MGEALLSNGCFNSNSSSEIPPLVSTIDQITYQNNYDGYTTKSFTIKKSISYDYIAMYMYIPPIRTTVNISSGVSRTIYYRYNIDSYEISTEIVNLNIGVNYVDTPELKYKTTVINGSPVNQATSIGIRLTIGCSTGYAGLVTIPSFTVTSTFI